jgi:type VI secretion system protein ImpA
MSTENIIDIANLIAPISQDAPQGIDVRSDAKVQSLYYDLKETRHNLRQQEDELLLSDDDNTLLPSWQAVIQQAETLLSSHSKDLEIAAWLVEGLVREHGYQGLIAGCQLLIQLVNQYAEVIYPEADEEGNVTRLMSIAMLSGSAHPGTVTSAINLTPITEVADVNFNMWELYQLQSIPSEQLGAQALVKAFDKLSDEQRSAIMTMWETTLQAINDLDTSLTAAYAKEAPSLVQLKEAISGALKLFKHILNTFYQGDLSIPEASPTEEEPQQHGSRQAAIKAIKMALGYYEDKEPHSPILYLLQRSLRWSEQDLQQIFSEIIVHDEMKEDMARALGMPFARDHVEQGEY